MTTRQLAGKVADAVLTDPDPDLAYRVLKVLHDEGCWFCRVVETPKGSQTTVMEQGRGQP